MLDIWGSAVRWCLCSVVYLTLMELDRERERNFGALNTFVGGGKGPRMPFQNTVGFETSGMDR